MKQQDEISLKTLFNDPLIKIPAICCLIKEAFYTFIPFFQGDYRHQNDKTEM